MTVKLFGPEAEIVGRRQVELLLPGDTADGAAIHAALAEASPALKPRLSQCRLAVNHEFVGDDHQIAAGDEVALIGSVSGG